MRKWISKNICECGHSVDLHASVGLRRCAKMNCPCDQYIEDDDAIEWMDQRKNDSLDVWVTVALLGVSLIALAKCLSLSDSPERNARVYTHADSVAIDSARGKGCVKGCACAMDGTILECPDKKPPIPKGAK